MASQTGQDLFTEIHGSPLDPDFVFHANPSIPLVAPQQLGSPVSGAQTDPETQYVGNLLFTEVYGSAPPPGTHFAFNAYPNPPMPPTSPQLLERSCSPASVGFSASTAETGRSRRGNCLRRLPQRSTLTPIARNGGLDIPENIEMIRQLFFGTIQRGSLQNEHYISLGQFEQQWPWVTNFWTRRSEGQYRCKFWKKPSTRSEGQGSRGKNIRRIGSCSARLHIHKEDVVKLIFNHRHNHSLQDLDIVAQPDAIKNHIAGLLRSGVTVKQVEEKVFARGQGPEYRQAIERAGGGNVTTQDIRNMSKALGTYQEDPRRSKTDVTARAIGAELQDVLGELQRCQNLWKSEFVEAQYKGQPSAGIVFAHKESLNTLRDRGCLAVMDSTHKTVRLKWYLFTVFVRDEVGSWIPASFFLTQKQDAEIIEACLRRLIEWCGRLEGWALKYMLTDDSAAEQLAVRNAFGYDPADENPRVQHLLCTKLSWETLKKTHQQ
ncbi:hypothetical protein V8E54_014507 [Elaphomyces granulatus]